MRIIHRCLLLLWVSLAVLGVASLRAQEPQPDAPAQLHALFKEEWEYTLRENPVFASFLGDRRYNDRWPGVSLEAIERRHQHRGEVLARLAGIDYAALSEADQLNYTLFRKQYELAREGHAYRWYLLPLDQRDGIQTAYELGDALRFATVKDYEDWIARLRAFPSYVEQTTALLREGIRTGMVHPKVIMERVPAQLTALVVDDAAESPFFKPFKQFSDGIPPEERVRLTRAAKQAVSDQLVPAFRRFQRFFNEEYLPACLDKVGIWQFPRGKEMYAYFARLHTTTDLTPEAIHQVGLDEVRRIRAEMDKIIEQVGFKGSFEEFLQFLRTDPQFYYTDPNELLEAYRALSKRIDPTLVKLFGGLPRMPYGVEPIPAHIAPDTTTAYYRQPAADGSRAGTYFVNLYRPEVRPKYEMEVLSIHEAVPGHHLQIALAMELGELPEFRRYDGYTAFVEGWGLYSESLGEELGFYQDPYSKFGQLTYEMWRAVRLVVDTGMHHLGWTRQQAIDFFKANAAKTETDIVNEIDRYIAWPGQALAYKIGELKIKELRARASRELGERFDIRAFHEVVLGSGAVPLDVLEAQVNAWIERSKEGEEAEEGEVTCKNACYCAPITEENVRAYPSSPWFLVKLSPGDTVDKARRLYGYEDRFYETKRLGRLTKRYEWRLAAFFLYVTADESGQILEVKVSHRQKPLSVFFGVELGKDTPPEVIRKIGYRGEDIWSRVWGGEGMWFYDICIDVSEGGETVLFGFVIDPSQRPEDARLLSKTKEVTSETFATIPVTTVELSYAEWWGLCREHRPRTKR